MSEHYKLFWQGEEIGSYEIVASDMGYFDGNWTSNDNPTAKKFQRLVDTFDIKKVFNKPQLGTTAMLRSDKGEIFVSVLGIIEGLLTLKAVSNQGAIDWLEKTMKPQDKRRSLLVRAFHKVFRKRA